ncbi:MAG: hypothetical protein Q7Q73_02295 [Verrucomicrobiota bacterium JB024]|nr:hypothetical protein [Verrucomicrobiota bacterium JB024]
MPQPWRHTKLAKDLGVDPRTVKARIREGLIRAKPFGTLYLIEPDEVRRIKKVGCSARHLRHA